MKEIWKKIKACFKAIFCRETISKVWTILFGGVKTSIGELLSNADLMDKAFELSKSLLLQDGTATSKADAFNNTFKEWATAEGYKIGSSALNVIRETAYAAVKAETEI